MDDTAELARSPARLSAHALVAFALAVGCVTGGEPYEKGPGISSGKTDDPDRVVNEHEGVVVVRFTELEAGSSEEVDFRIDSDELPSSTEWVVLTLSGGTGDADVFARFGGEPTMSGLVDHCWSANVGNEERCVMEALADESLYIKVHGYRRYSGATLTVWAVAIASGSCDFSHPPNPINSFRTAKRRLQEYVFHRDEYRITFYCQCPYGGDNQVDLESCGYDKTSDRADRMEWEHIVPADRMQYLVGGSLRQCAAEPFAADECFRDGAYIGPRECCQKSDEEFRLMHNDLHNLVPAVGEIGEVRSNHSFGLVAGEERRFGACDFEDDGAVAEPASALRGNVARAYLYLDAVYAGFALTPEERRQYAEWHMLDPVDEPELWKARRIAEVQGNPNDFVERGFQGDLCL